MNKLLPILLLIFLSITVQSQDSKFLRTFKVCSMSEVTILPANLLWSDMEYDYNPILGQQEEVWNYGYEQGVNVSIYSFLYGLRYNAYEQSDHLAVGINVVPDIQLSTVVEAEGFLALNAPVYLSIDFGAGATNRSVKDYGGFIGFGYEYNLIPLIIFGASETDKRQSWMQPLLISGYRFWNKNDRLFEFAFKYGFGNKNLEPGDEQSSIFRAQSFQLSYGWFIGY